MPLKNKRVLVTGINGFVGSYLASSLLNQGAIVFGLDLSEPAKVHNLKSIQEFQFINCDIRNISEVLKALDMSKPDIVFHLAAMSFVPESFVNPLDVIAVNSVGTANVLEAVRKNDHDTRVVFASSGEVYGLVISSEKQLRQLHKKNIAVFPEPHEIPELPIKEENPTRPISPYGVSKLHGEFLTRDYYNSYGVQTVISRAFNHEGAGRGPMFVSSSITDQVMRFKQGETDRISIGNVCAMRDWSHVSDIVGGYCLLAEKGESGKVYNQGSQRANSVLSYILLTLQAAGYNVHRIATLDRKKVLENPTRMDDGEVFGVKFDKTLVDALVMKNELEYTLEDGGLIVSTDKGEIKVLFDKNRYRPADIPILLSDITEIKKIGFSPKYTIKDIIRDQLDGLRASREGKSIYG